MSESTSRGPEGARPERGGSAPRPDEGRSGSGSERQPREVSFLQLTTVVLEHRRAVSLCLGLGVALAVGLTVLAAPDFTSRTTFTPQADGPSLQGLSGMASQLGIQVPLAAGGSGQSPAFYADLLRSRELRRATVETSYRVAVAGGDSLSGNLVEIFDVDGPDRPQRVEAAIKRLSEKTEVSTATETGVVQLSVTTRWPVLSRKIAERMLNLVNKFNLETRRSQAGAERRFLAQRVEEARKDLRAAEDSLERFLTRNRGYENSPQLRFEYERLQRRVSLQQQVYRTLATSFEQAKVEEVRNTPVITVVDPPETPAKPDPARLPLKALLGVLVGGLVGLGWALGSEMMITSQRDEPATYSRFEEAWRKTRADLAKLTDWVRRGSREERR